MYETMALNEMSTYVSATNESFVTASSNVRQQIGFFKFKNYLRAQKLMLHTNVYKMNYS